MKYIARAGLKDPLKELEDLQKARWYIDREIKRVEAIQEYKEQERQHVRDLLETLKGSKE